MSQEILEKVCSIVSEQLSVEAGEVKSDSNFQNDLGADSMKDMGKVISVVTEKVSGQAEGRVIAEIVKRKLMG